PNLSLRKGQVLLTKRGINVSILTLKRRLRENNVAWRSTVSKPLLSTMLVENHPAWAHENIDRDWSDIVFTDESSFWVLIPIKRAWSAYGKSIIEKTVKHPLFLRIYEQEDYGLTNFHDPLPEESLEKVKITVCSTSYDRYAF
ncbi:hypothetical protein WN51_07954, partial [Melipona quadrifasciata]